MRARYMILSVLLIVCFLNPVDAYTNHNLEWAIKTGVKYHFSADYHETNDWDLDGEIDEQIDLNVSYYGLIEEGLTLNASDDVTELQDVWRYRAGHLEDGDTSSKHPFYFVAIGNWSLLTLLVPEFIDNYWGLDPSDSIIIDNETVWGFRYESPHIMNQNIFHVEFTKEDGILSYFFREIFSADSITNLTQECRRLQPSVFLPDTLVIVGGLVGGLIIVIAVLVIIGRRRRP